MCTFRCPEIAQLNHELSLSPVRHRLRQLAGIARAVELIDPKREYPYAFVCFQVTGYHPRTTDDVLLDGRNLIKDLIQLAESLTRANPIPSTAETGSLHTVSTLAQRFGISQKTITRWRHRGLLGCWYDFGETSPRIAFSSRAVQRFVSQNIEMVRRGASFKHMGHQEKARLLMRARELVADAPCSMHAVTRCLANESGRAVETIRLLLRRHDHENPSQAIFDQAERPQTLDRNDMIYQAHLDGETIEQLSQRFNESEPALKSILIQARASQLAASPIDYIYHSSFDEPDTESRTIDSIPEKPRNLASEVDETLRRVPSELPAYLQALYRTPLLSPTEERELFRRMNHCLHQAEMLRRQFADEPSLASAAQIAGVDDWLARAGQIKQHIIQANLRLVVSIAKRHLPQFHQDHAAANGSGQLFELISDGNMALIRAVAKFDFARGYRFSTYASWAIMRGFARSVPGERSHVQRFRTGHDEILATLKDNRSLEADHLQQDGRQHLRNTLSSSLARLDERERRVVEHHYGLTGCDAAKTLAQIGREIGLSKERVRQIERRALAKLRTIMGPNGIELMAG